MQITVAIPDEFAAQVQASGLTPESFVEKLIAERIASPIKKLPTPFRSRPGVPVRHGIWRPFSKRWQPTPTSYPSSPMGHSRVRDSTRTTIDGVGFRVFDRH
jgi:hypothetical protein